MLVLRNMPLRVLGINAIGTRHSGAATVLLSLIDDLLHIGRLKKVVVFASPKAERRFLFPRTPKVSVVSVPPITGNPVLRFSWLQTCFSSWVRRAGCDVIYNLNNLAGRLHVPQALFIQQSLYFSEEGINCYYSSDLDWRTRIRFLFEPQIMRSFFQASIVISQKVIVQSHVMKETLERVFRMPPSKVAVLPPAMPRLRRSEIPSPKLSALMDKRYKNWLYVGNDAPYKNLNVITKAAMDALTEDKKWRFHLIGCDRKKLIEIPNIFLYPYMNRDEIGDAYSMADGLIMPSWTETVGLPMIEALSMKTPVVAADRPYAHEVCGPYALYFNPLSPKSLSKTLDQITEIDHAYLEKGKAYALCTFGDSKNGAKVWEELRGLVP